MGKVLQFKPKEGQGIKPKYKGIKQPPTIYTTSNKLISSMYGVPVLPYIYIRTCRNWQYMEGLTNE